MNDLNDPVSANRRQVLYWRMLVQSLGDSSTDPGTEALAQRICAATELPPLLMDPRSSIDGISRRHPELQARIDTLLPGDDDAPVTSESVDRAIIFGKVLLSVFGRDIGCGSVSAAQYSQWRNDVATLERIFGFAPGELMSGRGSSEGTDIRASHDSMPSMGPDTTASGGAPEVTDETVRAALDEIKKGRGLMSKPEIQAGLKRMEKSIIDRMALAEVLKDRKLAEKLTPSMALTEQLLRDKNHLSGEALRNAKILIKRYVDELADLLKKEVEASPTGKIDPRVPPRRTFRNLDLKRTLWRNLINWNPEEERLYVNQLYYKRTATRTNKTRLIIVVDQSGSMVSAMVNCTILASIFAALPKVDAHLVAFDTEVIDLSPWVHDPFEVLLRTNLGGGNDGPKAMHLARGKIVDPRNTVMVWISDFYEFGNDKPLLSMIRDVNNSGVTFIPVGSVNTGGYFNVNPYFRTGFKQLGIPLISGSLRTLIRELKTSLP